MKLKEVECIIKSVLHFFRLVDTPLTIRENNSTEDSSVGRYFIYNLNDPFTKLKIKNVQIEKEYIYVILFLQIYDF